MGWAVQIIKFLNYVVFSTTPPPIASSHLGSNILLNTLLSNTLSLRSPLTESHQVPHPYKTTGQITALQILIFILLDVRTSLVV